jgi:hypothetical protein
MQGASPFDYPEIPKHRVKSFLKIWGGASEMHPILQALHALDCHVPAGKIDRVLHYLIVNKITGRTFLSLLQECGNSHLELQRQIFIRMERDRDRKARLIAGKDFRV